MYINLCICICIMNTNPYTNMVPTLLSCIECIMCDDTQLLRNSEACPGWGALPPGKHTPIPGRIGSYIATFDTRGSLPCYTATENSECHTMYHTRCFNLSVDGASITLTVCSACHFTFFFFKVSLYCIIRQRLILLS